jgi:PHD/YefM family antitoxin component YafN of YafNO toxin-antitoxin module
MTRAVTEEEFELSKSDFVKSAGQQTVLIKRDGETVAVLTSPEQYETTREAKAERAIKAMWALREEMHSIATPEELLELEKALDRKAQ